MTSLSKLDTKLYSTFAGKVVAGLPPSNKKGAETTGLCAFVREEGCAQRLPIGR